MTIVLQRIYEDNSQLKGHRVLIDRVWPRGISKDEANLDEWMKDIAPSPSLRKWFNHDPQKFTEFTQAYQAEIKQDNEKQKKLNELIELAAKKKVILLYGAKDERHNHAVVLKELLHERRHDGQKTSR
ncbi:DUF488 domain-containing protein [Bacillus changyiensis]|uniref:DUF488 domain-containing protein n=1 Tax=Bacillus changyiensis TaxID=3004103 RepID=UPI0022E7D40F|nr:DUF488 domain-containing protein [Bacillus changyiensis]MDA1477069.1 DUF488 domain-containing protein [Bacillus changyiensis]